MGEGVQESNQIKWRQNLLLQLNRLAHLFYQNSPGALVSSAVAETDNDISSDRHSMKEEFQQFCRRILQLLCRGN